MATSTQVTERVIASGALRPSPGAHAADVTASGTTAAPTGSSAALPHPRRGQPAAAPAAPAAPAAHDIPQLTGLRFVAALWVLVHHVSFVPGEVYARWLAPLAPIAAAGPLGVDLFFVLSGLVLARSYLERFGGAPGPRQVASFLWARFARVWPLYAVVVCGFGAWCLARATFGGDDVVTWQTPQPDLGPLGWLRQLTMTQLWTSPDIEGISFVLPAWSVSAEWLAYLAFPALAVAAWRMRGWPRPVLAALAVLAASPVGALVLLQAVGAASGAWPWVARIGGGFTAGVLTWLVVWRIPRTAAVETWAHRIVLVVLAELLLVIYWAASAPASATLGAEARLYLAVPLFPVLLAALTLSRRGPAAWLSGARMQHGGRISYALYLVHFPMLEVTVVAMTRFDALAPNSSAAALLVPHVVVASILVAHLAYRFVEAPAQQWLRAKDPSRHRAGARRAGASRRLAGRRGGSHVARPVPA